MDAESLEEFRAVLRRFANNKIQLHAAAYDREARFPEESLIAFKELGLVSLASRATVVKAVMFYRRLWYWKSWLECAQLHRSP